jgi:DNA-binding response OmpR family regulator
MRILIVEDHPDILANLYGFLEPKGHQLDSARNGYGGLALASEHEYDVVVLDIMLPGLNGLELCHKLRTELGKTTPVLMLTARDSLSDKVSGFDSGADDYLVKPFSLVELEARLKALVRRSGAGHAPNAAMRFGELVFDPATLEASRGGVPVLLTKTGYTLLRCLLAAAPRIVSRETLEQAVWGENRPDSDALRTHIHALRQAIDKHFPVPMLQTVAGVGFKLVQPEAQREVQHEAPRDGLPS